MSAHADPADRFLVATSLVYDLTLVTADDALIDAKLCPILRNR
jgi:PIN domain nuclease of toxin-antitoxin system